jgi:hypothetical protein
VKVKPPRLNQMLYVINIPPKRKMEKGFETNIGDICIVERDIIVSSDRIYHDPMKG